MLFLKALKNNYFFEPFSHIYVEKKAYDYPLSKIILEKFKNSKVIFIDNYNEIFSRNNQNPYIQKLSPSLIIAVKTRELIYKGSRLCHDFKEENFYYTNFILNCLFDCDYCYLKGINLSSYPLFFVNLNDYFLEINKLIKDKKRIYLSISYDSDILLFERLYPFLEEWLSFAKKNSQVNIEIRTKSTNYKKFLDFDPLENVIISWSLTPEEVISRYERKTPSLIKRLEAASNLLEKGWKINLALDPLIYLDNTWEETYKNFINTIFEKIKIEKINSFTLGVFRIPSIYLKRMKKFSTSPLAFYPYQTKQGIATYPEDLKIKMINYVKYILEENVDSSKIYII